MKEAFIRSEVKCFAQARLLGAECYTKPLLCGFQQFFPIVACQAQIPLKLGLFRNFLAPESIFTHSPKAAACLTSGSAR